ncbi:MAG TPA: hypothetical protein VKG65_10350 [Terriglobales bacterium]|nr:hypothetical protein [Terriglobales bacterium]
MTANPSLTNRSVAPGAVSILSYAILLGGVITIGLALYLVVVSYSSLPYVDGWSEIDLVSGGSDLTLSHWLWEQHNEHRLVIPKLFVAADLPFFQARQVFLLASIFVIQLLHLALLAWSMRVLGGWRGDLWRTGTGLAAFCLFCPSQWFNFVLGFQVNFMLLGLFVTLSFIGLLLYWTRSQSGSPYTTGYLMLAIVAALGATYSLANGNLIWPLLLGAALWLRLRRSAPIALAVTGAFSTALYFFHYASPTAAANATSLQAAPGRFFSFVAVYLGSPWVHANYRAAALIGTAGAVIACALIARSSFLASPSSAFSVELVLTLLFCLGTSFVTALGRLNFGVRYALSPRYQTFALLFWCCLGLLLLGSAAAIWHIRVPLPVMQLVLLAVMLRGAYLARYPIREARLHAFQLNAASMVLLTGVYDSEQLSYVGVKLSYLMNEVPYLQRDRLSIYSGEAYFLLGKPLSSAFRVASPTECTGALESSATMGVGKKPPGLRITGWAWDYKHRRAPSGIIATTDGIIMGLAAVGDWRPIDQATRPSMTSNYIGFRGYLERALPSAKVEIYAIQRGSPATACLIATVK